jgi:osmotically inducible lipoprotein OsmB
MLRKFTLIAVAAGLPLVLAACGNTTEDRALSGAGIGAVTPIGPIGGALIGGAVGGAGRA